MTRLFNRPENFADELCEGFVAANRDRVRQVTGGVVRNTSSPEGEVALVVGGGTGHYPAFCGLVGPGLAHGAAMGNLFASPSAKQVYSVARAANNGGGVLLGFGNYAGDILHFGIAKARLNDEGIPCEVIAVTDDVSSAPANEVHKRRGIAGDLTVFKAAAAAAAEGYDFDATVKVANRANDRTRSLGVAFSGCTLPGASKPLFEVEAGKMALGMGIHGEPGIEDRDIPSADELAELMVSTLLNELPTDIEHPDGQRAAVILNGLGGVKYEELFVVYRHVAELLEQAGIQVVEPEVGELVTSFDMAGVSLTLFWLDDELERLWRAPASAPAYKKGTPLKAEALAEEEVAESHDELDTQSSAESKAAARCVLGALSTTRDIILQHAERLGEMDAIAGDGDHGIGMERGVNAAFQRASEVNDAGCGAGTLLIEAADAWADRAGGTSGALWGVALSALGNAIGNQEALTGERVAKGVGMAFKNIMQVGKASLGDKTMLDALAPFSEMLTTEINNGNSLARAWAMAADKSTEAAEATAHLLPKIGRARPLAEKSIGTPDPGAVSFALIVTEVGKFMANTSEQTA